MISDTQIRRKEDIVHVDQDARPQPRDDLEKNVDPVAPGPYHVARVNEQYVISVEG